MSEDIYCLVSRVAKPVPIQNGEIETNTLQVIACSVDDQDPKICIADGWAQHDPGGAKSAMGFLSGENQIRIFLKDGRNRYETEPFAVWFDRQCDFLDCPWFPAMARRMSSGKVVPYREIQEAYRKHNRGDEIPAGNWQQLREAWEILKSRALHA